MDSLTKGNIRKQLFYTKWLLDDKQAKYRVDLINREIAYIKGLSDSSNSYYTKPIIPIKMLYVLAKLKPISDAMLFDVVWDNASIPYWIKNKIDSKWDESINPAFKNLIEFISSEFFTRSLIEKVIPGDEVLIFENQHVPISVDAIQKFATFIKATPLTYVDVMKVQKEFERFKKDWHSSKNSEPESSKLISNKVKNLMHDLNHYKFKDFLERTKISVEDLEVLMDKHSGGEFVPYMIALLHKLGFIEYFLKNHSRNKTDAFNKLAKVFNASERRIRGNINILINANCKEDPTDYTSHTYTNIISDELSRLIKGR